MWFWKFHPERVSSNLDARHIYNIADFSIPPQIPSALDRYVNEIHRVNGVLETILNGKDFLVDNKFSYADISFTVWYPLLDWMSSEVPELQGWREKYPNVARWQKTIRERPSVIAAFSEKETAIPN